MILYMDVEKNTYVQMHCGYYKCWYLNIEWWYIGTLMILYMEYMK